MITDAAVDVNLLDDLLGRYTLIVDHQDWAAWPGLFAEHCSYEVQTLDNAERDLPLAYMLDDSRARLLDRVKFITEVWAGTVEPYRTRHVVQRTRIVPVEPDAWQVRSNFQVTYTEVEGPPAVLACGYYDDVIETSSAGAQFRSRQVCLDGMPARYLIYPL